MDKLNITPTPWRIREAPEGFGYVMVEDNLSFPIANTMAFSTDKDTNEMHRRWDKNNAEAIVKAVNGTYGVGINPEVVLELFNFIDHLLGSDVWQDLSWATQDKVKAIIKKVKL